MFPVKLYKSSTLSHAELVIDDGPWWEARTASNLIKVPLDLLVKGGHIE